MSLMKASATSVMLGLVATTGLWSTSVRAECSLALSQSDVDLGTLKRDSLTVSGSLATLGERSMSVDLQCDTQSDLTLFYRATAQDAEQFRFGGQGQYRLRMRDAVVDGVPVDLGEIAVINEAPSHAERSAPWRPERGLTPVKDGRVLQGKSLQAHVDITASAPLAALRVRDETRWLAPALIETFARDASREVNLSATLIPVACTPVLSGGGRIDYRQQSVSAFNRTAATTLPVKRVTLNVDCDAMALFALGVVDNRSGTARSEGGAQFGLGLSGGKRVGQYTLTLTETRVDDWGAANTLTSSRGGTFWSKSPDHAQLSTPALVGFARTAGAVAGPDELQHLSTIIEVAPTIAPLNDLDVSEQVELNGSTTIEIVYL